MGYNSRRRNRARYWVLATTAAVLLTSLPATAIAPQDGVPDGGTGPTALDSLQDVQALADATSSDDGVRVGVVTDRNGRLAGGQSATQVVVPAAEVARTVTQLAQVPGVLSAVVDEPVRTLGADPLAASQLSRTRTGAVALPDGVDGRGTVVAVVDTGVDPTHPDLSPPLADGQPRVLRGQSFLPGTDDDGTPGTTDPSGHGTHVAGTIAAARNLVGTVGLAPGAQVLPVRTVAADGTGWSSDVAAGIRWAHDQGADVINLSLGSTGPVPSSIVDAVDYATTDTSGGRRPSVVVAAAGNSGTSGTAVWPALLPRVIAVAATDSSDRVADFSSRADWVDVAAPGLDVLSTCSGATWCQMSGTSTSAPVVAATAALLRSQDPSRSPTEVQDLIEGTATDLGRAGPDDEYGHGLVRPAKALGLADVAALPARPAAPDRPAQVRASCFPTVCSVVFRTVGERVSGTFVLATPDGPGRPTVLGGGTTGQVVLTGLRPGTGYAIFLRSANEGGVGPPAVTFVRTPEARPAPVKRKAVRRRTVRRRTARR